MILPDWMIEKRMANHITPWNPLHVQPASYDLTLDKYFRFYERQTGPHNDIEIIDPKSPLRMTRQVEVNEYFELGPHNFVLACSCEAFRFPDDLAGRCEGKSSLGRMGLAIHVTAGFFDPGFEGTATLELFNANNFPIRLYPNMKIAQMSFHQMAGHVRRRYGRSASGNKYMDQGIKEPGPRESEYFRNFHREEYEGNWTSEATGPQG